MAQTPKSARRHAKADRAADRATQASYANLHDDNHPAHKQQVRALDRADAALKHTDRDFSRGVNRDQRTRGKS